jgi:hypothetical protein
MDTQDLETARREERAHGGYKRANLHNANVKNVVCGVSARDVQASV